VYFCVSGGKLYMRNKWLTLILIAVLLAAALPAIPSPVSANVSAQGSCGTAPALRLTVGQSARVVLSDGTGNNLRVSPNTTATVAGVLADGEVFSVIGGPQCTENFWWWEIRRWDGTTGWTAEGEAGDYWLEPWPILNAQLAPGSKPRLPGLLIAFLSGYEGYLVPQAMQVSGANLISVGNNVAAGPDNRLVWSPDGTRVAFSDGSDIWVATQSGTTNLTNDPTGGNTWPTWSPDGTRIAFTSMRDGNPEIYSMQANGLNPVNLTNNPAYDDHPAWSPDGTRIAFMSDRDGDLEIFSMSAADGSGPTQHTANDTDDLNPVWSPDGAKIAFVSMTDTGADLWVLDSLGPRALTQDSHISHPVWSPDGTRIAYMGELPVGSGREDVFSIRADGTDMMQYTVNGAPVQGVTWSPGGQWLAYADNSSGNFEIYAIRASGIGVVRLTNNPGIDAWPVFQPPTTPNLPDESLSAAAPTPQPGAPGANPGEEDLLLIYDADVPVFTLQNTSGGPINLEPLSFFGEGKTVSSDVWAEWSASPLDAFKNIGCLMIWPFGLGEQPAPPECLDARQGWVENSQYIFWRGGSFDVYYNNVKVTTCLTADKRCEVDLP
jgi:Tol biopolymer transport system component